MDTSCVLLFFKNIGRYVYLPIEKWKELNKFICIFCRTKKLCQENSKAITKMEITSRSLPKRDGTKRK